MKPGTFPQDCERLADEAETVLLDHVLSKWFPAAMEPAGGFHQTFDENWNKAAPFGQRTLVFQARMTWTAAMAAAHFPREPMFAAAARHGLAFLEAKFWDAAHGGFFWEVSPAGVGDGRKHAYGMAFGIFAAAGSFAVLADPAALGLAKRAFAWLERHGHDPAHGGYVEAFARDGSPILRGPDGDQIGTPLGLKSMNAHLHLLEAFAALYRVWPDPLVRDRLSETLATLRDRMAGAPGAPGSIFRPDWRVVRPCRSPLAWIGLRRLRLSDPVPQSHGHNIETAYLLGEAEDTLGAATAITRAAARALVDRALRDGFDHASGGFFHAGSPGETRFDPRKIWWVQAEGLNALLALHEARGCATAAYWDAFVRTWDFIRRHQLDARRGGWLAVVSADGQPASLLKSNLWTDPYHQTRALLNMSTTLRRLGARSSSDASPPPTPHPRPSPSGPTGGGPATPP
jgi:mannobiose 2-epimerase